MRTFKVLLGFCLFIHTIAFSQVKYSGQVLSESETPVEFANVVFLTQDSTFLAGGVTNEYGIYSFYIEAKEGEKRLPQFIKISSIGYETLLETLYQHPQEGALFRLKVKVEHLSTVTITQKRKAFSLTSNGTLVANVAAIPSLKNSGSLDDLLNKIPFIQGGGGRFSVLGTGGEAVLYLDGQLVQDANVLQRLRSQDIVSIEVLNTPGVQYKASAKAIIKIKTTKKSNSTGLTLSQYALMQKRLSTYTGANISQSNAKSYWSLNLGYSHTEMSNSNSDSYTMLSEDGSVLDVSSSSDIENRSNFLIGGLNMYRSYPKDTHIGLASNLSLGDAQFDINSSGLAYSKNGVLKSNTPFSSALDSRPYKSTSSLYYNGKIGKTSINITDEILFGRSDKSFIYSKSEGNASIETFGRQNYAMNSLMLFLQMPIRSLMIGYGAEWTMSFNKNELEKNEVGLPTDVLNSKVESRQGLIASFVDIRKSWSNTSLYLGVRHEYEHSTYTQNGIKASFSKDSPHFVSPTVSLSYKDKSLGLTLSYRKNITRPAYSSMNNFTLFESQYVYQQGNPFLRNQINDIIQAIGAYKNVSFTASYNYIQRASGSALARHNTNESILLKQVVNIPHYSVVSLGLNWKDTFGPYSPAFGLSWQKQFLEYQGRRYNQPMIRFSTQHYIELGDGWRSSVSASYISRNNNLFYELSGHWNYNIMLSKSIKNFTFDLGLKNLFLDNSFYRKREMSGIIAKEIEWQDYSGVSLNVSYRLNSVRARYSNQKTSNESKRF